MYPDRARLAQFDRDNARRRISSEERGVLLKLHELRNYADLTHSSKWGEPASASVYRYLLGNRQALASKLRQHRWRSYVIPSEVEGPHPAAAGGKTSRKEERSFAALRMTPL